MAIHFTSLMTLSNVTLYATGSVEWPRKLLTTHCGSYMNRKTLCVISENQAQIEAEEKDKSKLKEGNTCFKSLHLSLHSLYAAIHHSSNFASYP
jgi:hypothetical protein